MGEMIPIVAILAVFGIPIIAILTTHQRKMAELIHGGAQTQNDLAPILHEVRSMREEMNELKQELYQQKIEMDDLKALGNGSGPSLEDRMGDGAN